MSEPSTSTEWEIPKYPSDEDVLALAKRVSDGTLDIKDYFAAAARRAENIVREEVESNTSGQSWWSIFSSQKPTPTNG